MSKYTKDDADVTVLDNYDRVSYETYLLNYNVDANVETAKGNDSIRGIIDIMKGGKPKFGFGSPKAMYTMIFVVLIGIAFVLIAILLIFFLIQIIKWFFKKDGVSKLYWKLSGLLIIFIICMIVLILIMVKLKNKVQDLIEKIVYKL